MANKVKIKATIFDRKGKIISIGYNSYVKTHPTMKKYASLTGEDYKSFLHAEVHALIRCTGIPHKIKIERYDKKGNPKIAKPCPICELAILESGIKIVEYTIG